MSNLVKAYNLSKKIEIRNGLLTSFVGINIVLFLLVLYLQKQNCITLGLVLAGVVFIIVFAFQTYRRILVPPLLITGHVIGKQEYRSGSSSIAETKRRISLEITSSFEILPDGGKSVIPSGKHAEFDSHFRIFHKMRRGAKAEFLLTPGKVIFATVEEMQNMTEEELECSLKSKLFELTFLGICFLIICEFLLFTIIY